MSVVEVETASNAARSWHVLLGNVHPMGCRCIPSHGSKERSAAALDGGALSLHSQPSPLREQMEARGTTSQALSPHPAEKREVLRLRAVPMRVWSTRGSVS